ncbi:MAG TPA: autotransporter-associated beta strand repeat-containing protein [Chthoniobacterales bacterium]
MSSKHFRRSARHLTGGLAASFAGLALLTPIARAADATWNVDAADSWATDAAWNPAAAPGSTSSTTSTDTATFGSVITAARTVTVDANRNVSGINFSGNSFAYTLSGGNLLLSAGGTIQTSGAGSNTFVDNVNSAITLQGDYAFTAGSTNTNHTLSIGTTVTSAVVGGTTTLTLNGANTGVAGTNTVTNVITGIISNGTSTVAISKSGAGKWALSGANTYSGGTTVTAGILEVRNNNALGTGAVTLNGGTLQGAGGANVSIANNIVAQTGTTSTLTTNGRDLTIAGNITGSGNINRSAPPTATTVFLSGNNSGYTGTFTQANNGNAVVRFGNANGGSAAASWVFQNTTAGRTTLDYAGSATISFGSMTGNGHIQANIAGTKTISAGALGSNDTFSGILAANTFTPTALLALTKVGSGTLTLSGANTYTAGTLVSGGTLATSGTGTLGTGNVTLDGTSPVVLTLGSAVSFGDSATLTFAGNSTINMNFTGSDVLGSVTNGSLTLTPGSYTAAQLNTFFGGSNFVDAGALGGTLTVVPEPHQFALAIVGLLGVMVFMRRRNQQA